MRVRVLVLIGILGMAVASVWGLTYSLGRIDASGSFRIVRDGSEKEVYGTQFVENYDIILNGAYSLRIELHEGARIELAPWTRCYIYAVDAGVHVVLISGLVDLSTEYEVAVFASDTQVRLLEGSMQVGRREDGAVGVRVLDRRAIVTSSDGRMVLLTPQLSASIAEDTRYHESFDVYAFVEEEPIWPPEATLLDEYYERRSAFLHASGTVNAEAALLKSWWDAYTRGIAQEVKIQDHAVLYQNIVVLGDAMRKLWMVHSLVEAQRKHAASRYEIRTLKETLRQHHTLLKITSGVISGSW